MSFLQPILLWALPLALLPILIHLIHLHRRRTVEWAATRFLLAAQKMNQGYSRLRRILILLLRVFAVAALILMVCRPLAGGLLGFTGGAPNTVLVLLDRSASMEQQNLSTGVSKRQAGLTKLSEALEKAYRGRSRIVLIDSASRSPEAVRHASDLTQLPTSQGTDTTADLPGLLQDALDYTTANKTGRTDIWIVSDLQCTDWDPTSGRWETLRSGFSLLPGVKFHLLTYPGPAGGNLSLNIEHLRVRSGAQGTEITLDLNVTPTITPKTRSLFPSELPIRFVINGSASAMRSKLENGQLAIKGHTIPLGSGSIRGWGRIEIPADTQPADNVWHFVFDAPPVMRSAVISDDPSGIAPVMAALGAPADPSRNYQVDLLPSKQVSEIAWDETGLIVWQIPLPATNSNTSQLLSAHLAEGRSLLFLPPATPAAESFLGISWGAEVNSDPATPESISWWRSDSGLLAKTRSGKPLPVGEVEITMRRKLLVAGESDAIPLARVASDNSPLLLVAGADAADRTNKGLAAFLATPPSPGGSTLARDGVILYALLHRSLDAGTASLGTARQRSAGWNALGLSPDLWAAEPGSMKADAPGLTHDQRGLRAGVYSTASTIGNDDTTTPLLTALNRPRNEDEPRFLAAATLSELFAGLEHRIIVDTIEDDSSLASEIWKSCLMLMAVALLVETILSLPRISDARTSVRPSSL